VKATWPGIDTQFIHVGNFPRNPTKMLTWHSVCFSGVALTVILSIHIRKRRRNTMATTSRINGDMSDFLDWIEDIPASPISRGSEQRPDTPSGDNTLFRGLAAVGLAPTAPRDARNVRAKTPQIQEHPASGNDEIADDVVRVARVSEEEEAQRYFSAFSFYRD